MPTSYDPVAVVRRYIDAVNAGDADAMAGMCVDSMQILDPMPPHVWQGPMANRDWWDEVLAKAEHSEATDVLVRLDEPAHVDVTGEHAYVVVPAVVTFEMGGSRVTQTGSVFTVALRNVDSVWLLAAWTWTKGG